MLPERVTMAVLTGQASRAWLWRWIWWPLRRLRCRVFGHRARPLRTRSVLHGDLGAVDCGRCGRMLIPWDRRYGEK